MLDQGRKVQLCVLALKREITCIYQKREKLEQREIQE